MAEHASTKKACAPNIIYLISRAMYQCDTLSAISSENGETIKQTDMIKNFFEKFYETLYHQCCACVYPVFCGSFVTVFRKKREGFKNPKGINATSDCLFVYLFIWPEAQQKISFQYSGFQVGSYFTYTTRNPKNLSLKLLKY